MCPELSCFVIFFAVLETSICKWYLDACEKHSNVITRESMHLRVLLSRVNFQKFITIPSTSNAISKCNREHHLSKFEYSIHRDMQFGVIRTPSDKCSLGSFLALHISNHDILVWKANTVRVECVIAPAVCLTYPATLAKPLCNRTSNSSLSHSCTLVMPTST